MTRMCIKENLFLLFYFFSKVTFFLESKCFTEPYETNVNTKSSLLRMWHVLNKIFPFLYCGHFSASLTVNTPV